MRRSLVALVLPLAGCPVGDAGSLPSPDAPAQQQADALREWSWRLRLPLALDDAAGRRIGASESFLRREADGGRHRGAQPPFRR